VTRDFASKSKKRTNATRFKESKQESISNFKTILMGLSLGVVITLIAVYYYLSPASEDTATETVEKTPEKPSAESRYKAVPAEEVVGSDFSFHEELKDKEVEVEVPDLPEAQAKSDRTYIMQCGSFTQRNRADEVKAKIALTGLEAWIRSTTSESGKVWHRVTLGPYESKRQAERDRHELQRNNLHTCVIW